MGGPCNYALLFVLLLVVICEGEISDRRLCGDPKCSEPVSYAKTQILYISASEGILSFRPNENVKVYSKSAGSRIDLWGVEIRGKRGYAPRRFLIEYKVLKKDLKYEIPTEKLLSNAGAENVNLLDKNGSVTTTHSPQNIDNVSLKESSDSNSQHTPMLSSNEQGSTEILKDDINDHVEDKPFSDGITQPFEYVDGTTIYLPSDEESQAEPLPIQATMTSGTPSSIKVGATSIPMDRPLKVEPSTLSVQENAMISDIPSSSPVSAHAENNLDEKHSLPEMEKETEDGSGLYSIISSWISEGSGTEEHKANTEEIDKIENIEKPLVENLKTKAEPAANEDQKRTEDGEDEEEEEEEGDDDEDDYGDEYDDEDEEEDESVSQETSDALLDENSRDKQEVEIGKNLERLTEHSNTTEEIATEEGKLSLKTLSEKLEKSTEVSSKAAVSDSSISDKSEHQRDEPFFESSNREESLLQDATRARAQIEKVKQSMDVEAKELGSDKSADQYSKSIANDDAAAAEKLSADQKDSNDVENLASKPVMLENVDHTGRNQEAEDINNIQSANSIPEYKNEGVEEIIKETTMSSSNNLDVQSNLSPIYNTENLSTGADIVVSDSSVFAGELKSDSVQIANVTDANERQEKSNHEEGKIEESLSENLQPKITAEDAFPGQDEQWVSGTENVSPTKQETATDYSLDQISTEPSVSLDEILDTDLKENIKLDSEMISEVTSNGLLSGIANSFWSSFGNLLHIFIGGSEDQLSESTGDDDANVEEGLAQKMQERQNNVASEKMKDEAIYSLWSESQPSSANFANEKETQACVVDSEVAVGIDSDCDAIGELSRVYKKAEVGYLTSQESDESVRMDVQKSFNTVLYLIITAVTVLLFSLGHYYIEKKRRDGSLVAKINELEKALLVSSKECIMLKDDLEATKEKLQSIENSSTDSNETLATLNIQLQETKLANSALEEQVASLEKELEQATEAGLELNRMLTEFLSAQHGSDTLMKSVEHLQKQLDSQQGTITTMTESLNAKTTENENLQAELKLANEKIHSLEEELQKVKEKLQILEAEKTKVTEESTEKSKEFQNRIEEIIKTKEEEISILSIDLQVLQDSVMELKDNLVTKDSEIAVLQDCIKQMKNYDDGDDTLQALLDVGETKAELKLMTIERNTLLEKLQIEEDARKLLEDHVKVIKEEVVRLRENYEEAEKEKSEAQTKLEVLSNYFKEKETQLQKELGLQEAMCLQKEGDATSTSERIKSLQEEIENYNGELPSSSDTVDSNKDTLKKKKIKKVKRVRQSKGSQNEALKKEILDQERGLKSQISSLEKKAHENWIAARQSERKLEETKQEAGQLRNRLTVVEKNITNASKNGEPAIMNDRMPADSNGDIGTSPVHVGITALADSSSPLHYHDGLPSPPLPVMLPSQPLPPNSFMGMHPSVFIPPPPPPGAPFMPPPPPLFPGDRRPPPLGRMSSPPPPRRYSSPPPPPTESRSTFSPYEHSPPTSPPLPDRLYRSPPLPLNDSPSRFKHTSPPPPPHFSTRLPPHWDDPHGTPRSGFRPLPPPTHRDSPREPKGSTLSSGHSSESLEKSSRHSGRV